MKRETILRTEGAGTGSAMEVLDGGGEMGGRMRSIDWSRTPLGPIETWPQNLRTCIRIILTSSQPMFVWWGESLINLYNDAYKSIVGGKHPGALAQPASVVWKEIWDQVGPRAEAAMQSNVGTYDEALLLIMERNGYKEETYYTFSYSPVPNDRGGTGGILCANTDDTRRVIGERRLALLRDLAAKTAYARTLEEACARTAGALGANPKDIPFALVYRYEAVQDTAVLAAAAGGERGASAFPSRLTGLGEASPSLLDLFASDKPVRLDHLETVLGHSPISVWGAPVTEAVAMPIATSGLKDPIGFLIVGLNPYLPLNEDYRNFLELVASQVSTGLSNGLAYEEEKRRAQALADLDRAKTEFFSNVSHEFRTPLTLMLGPAEDLLREGGEALSPTDRERVSLLYRNSLRLMKLVNTLLDFSRIESGRTRMCLEPIDLAAHTRELASAFQFAVERAGLGFHVDCPPLGFSVLADRDMWEKIVLNLLSNAFKFTFSGSISVSLTAMDGEAELTVADTGIGIPEAELPNFSNASTACAGPRPAPTKAPESGSRWSRNWSGCTKGRSKLRANRVGGTWFRVRIPAGTGHQVPGPASTSPQQGPALGAKPFVEEALRWLPGGPASKASDPDAGFPGIAESHAAPESPSEERIFLVDDNRDMGDYLKRILSPYWKVEHFPDGAAALEAALAHPPDLVLSDVMMPRLDGFGLLKRLKEEPATASTPVILLSARAGEEATVQGINAGVDDYLVKPFSSREVIARVGARLEVARLRKMKAIEDREHMLELRKRDQELERLLARERAAHAEAEGHRERLESLFTEAPALIAILKGAGYVFEFANPLYRALLGGRDLIGKPLKEVIPGLEAQAVMGILDRVLTTGESYHGREFPFAMDWGGGHVEEKFFDLVYQAVRDREKRIQGVAVYGFEVTGQVRSRRQIESLMADLTAKHERLRRVESDLRENQDRLQLTLEAVKLGTWDFHPETGSLNWSMRTREIFGLDADAALDFETFQAHIHPEDRDRVLRAIREAMEPGSHGQLHHEHRIMVAGSTTPRWVEGRGKGLFRFRKDRKEDHGNGPGYHGKKGSGKGDPEIQILGRGKRRFRYSDG